MQLNPIVTEQTTAATDLLLALAALAGVRYLGRLPVRERWQRDLWRWILRALAAGAMLAALAHGLVLPSAWQGLLWTLIYLALGLTVCGFVVAAVHDLRGVGAARRTAGLMLPLLLLLLVVIKRAGDDFTPFVLFEGIAMLAAFAVYAYLGWGRGERAARWMLAGIGITLAAATLQALQLGAFVCIWPFDHNGTFHLVQLAGLLCILLGLRASLRVG